MKLDNALFNLLTGMLLPLWVRAWVERWYSTTCSNQFVSRSPANWDC